MTELIETAPHEFNANYNFAGGLDGYFACDASIKQGDGSRRGRFEAAGDTWSVKLYFQDSNIVHPGDYVHGTPFRLDEIREFRVSVEAIQPDKESSERSFNSHIRPRWKRMRVETEYGNERRLNVPFETGVNVRFTGSNIEFQNYHRLLKRALETVDVNSRYFETIHESSVVTQAERYVRVHEDRSGPVHARDGPLARLGHLLEGDRDGRREVEQADVAEDGEQVPGYRHQVGLDEERVREVFPDHELPQRWKHYRARQSHNLDKDDPMRHPKVGAIYYGSLWRDKSDSWGVSPDELEQLTQELEDSLLSILSDAGLDVTSTRPYVSDDYFEARTNTRDRQVVDLPLHEIETTQESVVISQIADGLSPVEWESLETLVTDGGEVSPQDIADSGGFHLDSVYRALDRMEELIEREYGSVSLRSTHVAELVHDAVSKAREGTREAVEAAGKALDAADRGLDESTSALVAWASRFAENFRETDEGLHIDFGEIDAGTQKEAMNEIRKRLREGKNLWRDAGKDMIKWKMGKYSATMRHEVGPSARGATNSGVDQRTYSVRGKLHEIDT